MLDFDLAELYQVETKRLKEAVRRNIEESSAASDVYKRQNFEDANCDLKSNITKCVLKLGWSSLYAICFYGNGCRNAFERPA